MTYFLFVLAALFAGSFLYYLYAGIVDVLTDLANERLEEIELDEKGRQRDDTQ